jgi:hypothetical protein
MTHADQITAAAARAADTTRPAAERRWWADHVAYLQALPAHRAAYREIRAATPLTDAAFDDACRAEVDEDVAGDDAGEWVRAARVVQTRTLLAALDDYEPDYDEPDEAQQWARAIWNRACDDALDHPADW